MQFLAIVLGQPPRISSNQSLPHLTFDSVANHRVSQAQDLPNLLEFIK